jgi:CHAT domain-containing protein
LAIARELKDQLGETNDLENIGITEEELGHYDDALIVADQAKSLDRQLLAPEDLWRDLFTAAFAESHLDRRDAALADYDAALDQIESLRAGLAQTERTSFFSNKLFVYDEYIAYLRDLNARYPGQGYDRKALEIFERKAGRAALEQIGASAAQHFAGVPVGVIAQETAVEAASSAAQTNDTKLLALANPNQTALASAKATLSSAQAAQTAYEAQIKANYPQYYALRHPQPIDATTLQQALEPGQVIVIYDLLKQNSVAWVVTRDRFQFVTLPSSQEIDVAVAAARAHIGTIEASGTRPHTPEEIAAFDRDSYKLYQTLLPDSVAQVLAGAKSLIVVPSGSLYQMPFAALVARDPAVDPAHPHYLIEDLPISYVSSASLFAAVAHSYADHHVAPHKLLAFANPTFPQAATTPQPQVQTILALAPRGVAAGTFKLLPNTQIEAEQVATALGEPPDIVISHDDATRQRVLDMNANKSLATYRYVLFATHAVLPDQIKGESQPSIVLAHPELGNGFLTMADVFGLSLDADFVMLSACETGVVTDPSGDGISGLTRAFLYAGTPAVSVTLWQVDDLAGPQLTPTFFAGMQAGKTPAQALRDAQLAMIHSDDLTESHPFEWAPFVIFGDGDLANAR